MDLPDREFIWRFVRGDMPVTRFEEWVYTNGNLEGDLGSELYLEVVSVDFASSRLGELLDVRQKLGDWLRRSADMACACVTIADLDVIDMGSDRDAAVFATLDRLASYGEARWWLSMSQCNACHQHWLVAQEERQNDIFIMKRLSGDEASLILERNTWPEYFESYEELLRIGMDHGRRVSFLDPLSPGLVASVIELAKEKPGISISEVAALLDVERDVAVELARKAAEQAQVRIAFD